jgi:hypothetical protein
MPTLTIALFCVAQYTAPDRFGRSIRVLLLLRVLRPLRTLEAVPALRSIVAATLSAVKDLGNVMLIVVFFLLMFSIFLSSLLSSALRYRCYNESRELFYEPRELICSGFVSERIGRQCVDADGLRMADVVCVDAALFPSANHSTAHLPGRGAFDYSSPWRVPAIEPLRTRPYRIESGDSAPEPIDANPPYIPSFDSFGWSLLSVFEVWAGVGWTSIMYYVADSQASASRTGHKARAHMTCLPCSHRARTAHKLVQALMLTCSPCTPCVRIGSRLGSLLHAHVRYWRVVPHQFDGRRARCRF